MKIIKFRAWHKKQKRFINLNGVEISFKGCLSVGEIYMVYEQGVLKSYPITDIELMQFTGLSDNNGLESKEVYGGDILYNSDRDEYQEVIYNEDEARWDIRYAHGEQRSLADAIGNLNIVAGNIHQNPELLES